MALISTDLDPFDPDNHSALTHVRVELSRETRDHLRALARRLQAEDGVGWTLPLLCQKLLEEYAMNRQDMGMQIEVLGQLPGREKELIRLLAIKSGLVLP